MIWKKGANSEMAIFADDKKIFKIAKFKTGCKKLQRDFTKLDDWARKWQMKINVDTCKIKHIGKHNPVIQNNGVQTSCHHPRKKSWNHCG